MLKPRESAGIAALSAKTHIELCGNREAVVEGCCGILEYGGDTVRVRTRERTVRFSGRGLAIRCMTEDALVVTGCILKIEYLE